MKKLLTRNLPIIIAVFSIVVFCAFLRINLYYSTNQLAKEFKSQNKNEIYAIDTLKIASRLNSFSSSLNWICIEGEVNGHKFYSLIRNKCETGILYQKSVIDVPEANNLKLSFTLGFSTENQIIFILLTMFQILIILGLITSTKISEKEKMLETIKLNQIARKMFHDIRSPLAYLNSEIKDTSNHNLKIAIARINDVANSMLNNTRKQSFIELPDYHFLNSILENSIREIQSLYPKVNITYSNQNSLQAFFVPSEMKRIISNLLTNSIQASGDNCKIDIELKMHDTFISFTIKDNGPGFPLHLLELIGKKEVTTKTNGNGLGLLSAFESISEWNGNLNIKSSNETGTTIEITLLSNVVINFILLDNDELVRMNWEIKAKRNNINLQIYESPQTLLTDINKIDKDTYIYLDSDLGCEKGEDLAILLNQKGFKNIFICSGHPESHFSELKFLKGVIDKNPPF